MNLALDFRELPLIASRKKPTHRSETGKKEIHTAGYRNVPMSIAWEHTSMKSCHDRSGIIY
jgi:hypothetical protein